MDSDVSEAGKEDCEPGAEIFSECLEEEIIKRTFINDKVKEGEMVLELRAVCISKKWSLPRGLVSNGELAPPLYPEM